jgi:hypothetical protein
MKMELQLHLAAEDADPTTGRPASTAGPLRAFAGAARGANLASCSIPSGFRKSPLGAGGRASPKQ